MKKYQKIVAKKMNVKKFIQSIIKRLNANIFIRVKLFNSIIYVIHNFNYFWQASPIALQKRSAFELKIF